MRQEKCGFEAVGNRGAEGVNRRGAGCEGKRARQSQGKLGQGGERLGLERRPRQEEAKVRWVGPESEARRSAARRRLRRGVCGLAGLCEGRGAAGAISWGSGLLAKARPEWSCSGTGRRGDLAGRCSFKQLRRGRLKAHGCLEAGFRACGDEDAFKLAVAELRSAGLERVLAGVELGEAEDAVFSCDGMHSSAGGFVAQGYGNACQRSRMQIGEAAGERAGGLRWDFNSGMREFGWRAGFAHTPIGRRPTVAPTAQIAFSSFALPRPLPILPWQMLGECSKNARPARSRGESGKGRAAFTVPIGCRRGLARILCLCSAAEK